MWYPGAGVGGGGGGSGGGVGGGGAVLPAADVAEADVSTAVAPAMGAGKLALSTLAEALASTA